MKEKLPQLEQSRGVENNHVTKTVEAISSTERHYYENEVSEMMKSELFLKMVRGFPEILRNSIIGLFIEYTTLFPGADLEEVIEYIEKIKQFKPKLKEPEFNQGTENACAFRNQKTQLVIDIVCKKLFGKELKEIVQTDEESEAIYSYLYKRRITEGYVYHGFSSSFKSSIEQHGLQTHHGNICWEDGDEVRDIFYALDNGRYYNVLGWSNSSQGKIYYTNWPEYFYGYGLTSPEWFYFFASAGSHYKSSGVEADDKAIYTNNYASARRNVETLCDTAQTKDGRKITPEQKQKVLSFFDRYWNILIKENRSPCVALIHRSIIEYPKQLEIAPTFRDFKENMKPWEKGTLHDAIYGLLNSYEMNEDYDKNIPPESIAIIDLPSYEQIHL